MQQKLGQYLTLKMSDKVKIASLKPNSKTVQSIVGIFIKPLSLISPCPNKYHQLI